MEKLDRNLLNWTKSTAFKVERFMKNSNLSSISDSYNKDLSSCCWPWPIGSWGHVPPTLQIQYAFSESDFNNFINNEKNEVIIQNGIDIENENYIKTGPFFDNFIIFKNSRQKINNISTSTFKKILSGEITNWRNIGGSDHDINIYRYHPKNIDLSEIIYKKHNLALSNIGIDISKINKIKNVSTYKKLYNIGTSDKNSLIIGLRGQKLNGLNPIDFDGNFKKNTENYSLRVPLYFSFKKELSSKSNVKKFLIKIEKRHKTDFRNLFKSVKKI